MGVGVGIGVPVYMRGRVSVSPASIFGDQLEVWYDSVKQGENANWVTWSNKLDEGVWTPTNLDAPTLVGGYWQLQGTTNNGDRLLQSVSGIIGQPFSLQVKYQKGPNQTARLATDNFGNFSMDFNLSTGQITANTGDGGSVQDGGDHWIVTFYFTPTGTSGRVNIYPDRFAGAGNPAFVKDVMMYVGQNNFTPYQETEATAGGLAAQLDDFSGNNNHGVPVAQANMALVSVDRDGRTSWVFDGVDDSYQLTTALVENNEFSVWWVGKANLKNTGFYGGVRVSGVADGVRIQGSGYFIQQGANGSGYVGIGPDWDDPTETVVLPAPWFGNWHYHSFHHLAAERAHYMRDVYVITTTAIQGSPQTISDVGDYNPTTSPIDGPQRLWVMVSGPITDDQRDAMNEYCASLLPPFNPAELADAELFVQGDLGITIDDGVSIWENQVEGNTFGNFVQADTAKQPDYLAQHFPSGKPAIRGVPANLDMLELSGGDQTMLGTEGLSIIVAMMSTTSAMTTPVIAQGANHRSMTSLTTGQSVFRTASTSSNLPVEDGTWPASTPMIYEVYRESNGTCWSHRTADGTGTQVPDTRTNTGDIILRRIMARLNNSNHHDGAYGCVLIVRRVLSDDEKSKVREYFKNYMGS